MRQRVDVLLKASVIVPSPVTVADLIVATRDLVTLAPEDSEAIAMRLERARPKQNGVACEKLLRCTQRDVS